MTLPTDTSINVVGILKILKKCCDTCMILPAGSSTGVVGPLKLVKVKPKAFLGPLHL